MSTNSSRKIALSLPERPQIVYRDFQQGDANGDTQSIVVAKIEECARRQVVRSVMGDYLIGHGRDDHNETFDVTAGLFGSDKVPQGTASKLYSLLEVLRLAVVVPTDEVPRPPLALCVYDSGTNARAVATGYALKLLCTLDEDEACNEEFVNMLDPSITPATPFVIRDKSYTDVATALSALGYPKQSASENEDIMFEVAEGLVLYNKAQYWALLTSGYGLRVGSTEPLWWEQLTLLRRLLLDRDFGAFFVDSGFIPLASRFLLVVPEAPESARIERRDQVQEIFNDILNRVERATVLRFLAVLQFYEDNPKTRLEVIRHAKREGVLRALVDAMYGERTPIKVVDYCLQVFTTIAQCVSSTRTQEPYFYELFGENGAGDLLDTAVQRGEEKMTVTSIITRYFLHRRDAWVVISYIHPSFIHINERLVHESIRRAIVVQAIPAVDHTGNYKANEDLLMVASAMVILSHALTNPNVKPQQLVTLRPCLPVILRTAVGSVLACNSKLPGWNHQQRRLVAASMRVAVTVVHDAVIASKTDGDIDIPHPIITDCIELVQFADATSTAMCLAAEILRGCCLLKRNGEFLIDPVDVDKLLNIIQRRFVDSSCSDIDEEQTHHQQCNRDQLVEHIASILAEFCVHRESLVAGSMLMSLGLQQYEEWAVPALRSLRNLVENNQEDAQVDVQPLAASLAPVCVQALSHADVTAVKTILTSINSVLQKCPTFATALLHSNVSTPIMEWLTQPLHQIIEAEGMYEADDPANADGQEEALDLTDEERHKRIASVRSGILRALFEALRSLAPQVKNAPADEITKYVSGLIRLAAQFIEEVPHLSYLAQSLLIVAECGVDKGAFEHAGVSLKSIIRQISESSKANLKICTKLSPLVLGQSLTAPADAVAAKPKKASASDVAQVSAGETSDRMEFLSNSNNKFQFLVAAPSEKALRQSQVVTEKVVVDTKKKIPPPPKGFALIKVAPRPSKTTASNVHAGEDSSYEPKKIRDSASRQKDALSRDQKKKVEREGPAENDAAPTRGGKVVLFQPVNVSKTVPEPPKVSADVTVKGDGINVDIINVHLDAKKKKQDKNTAAKAAPPAVVASSWASMAKQAKTREEREAEVAMELKLEEERLQRLVEERAEARRKQEESRRKAEETAQRKAEEKRQKDEAAAKNKRSLPMAIGDDDVGISSLSASLKKIVSSDVRISVKRSSAAPPAPPVHLREQQLPVAVGASGMRGLMSIDSPVKAEPSKPFPKHHKDPWDAEPLRALGIDDDEDVVVAPIPAATANSASTYNSMHEKFVAQLTATDSKPTGTHQPSANSMFLPPSASSAPPATTGGYPTFLSPRGTAEPESNRMEFGNPYPQPQQSYHQQHQQQPQTQQQQHQQQVFVPNSNWARTTNAAYPPSQQQVPAAGGWGGNSAAAQPWGSGQQQPQQFSGFQNRNMSNFAQQQSYQQQQHQHQQSYQQQQQATGGYQPYQPQQQAQQRGAGGATYSYPADQQQQRFPQPSYAGQQPSGGQQQWQSQPNVFQRGPAQ